VASSAIRSSRVAIVLRSRWKVFTMTFMRAGPAVAQQVLFSKFLEIEDGHLAIVQAQLDSVQGMGFWFDIAEFRLEAE